MKLHDALGKALLLIAAFACLVTGHPIAAIVLMLVLMFKAFT